MNQHEQVTLDPDPLNLIIVNENKRTSSETFQFGDPHPHAGALDPFCATSILKVVLYEFLTFRAYDKQLATQ